MTHLTGITLEPGTLWQALERTTAAALDSGALHPIATEQEIIEDRGVPFLVRSASSLARKTAAVLAPGPLGASPSGKPFDPFLPYDPSLLVAELSATHLGLLNKFNVVDHHLLIVTRQYEPQESLLTLADFQAFCACLAEIDGLGFYNAGRAAGASQGHKHLQLVPLPLVAEGPRVPIEAAIGVQRRDQPLGPGPVARIDSLSFAHAFAPLSLAGVCAADMALELHDCYGQLLGALAAAHLPGSDPPGGGEPMAGQAPWPYNLLVTRHWMLLVARSRESFQSISVNALGFAGSLFVRNAQELGLLKAQRPMALLEAVAMPWTRGPARRGR